MPIPAILLLLTSALIHLFWNLIGKRSHPSAAFFLVASLASLTILSPVWIVFRDAIPAIPVGVWILLALTGCAQAVYYSALAGAYRSTDLSLVYPIVRALPVPLVALTSILLGRGELISPIGAAGMALIVSGCLLVPMDRFHLARYSRASRTGLLLAGLAALGTTGYMLVDDAALRLLRDTPGIGMQASWIAVFYMSLQSAAIVLALALYVWRSRGERSNWQQVRQNNWRPAAATGLVISAGYLLVLIAMPLVKDVSYVTAFRQVSIPIGALLGILVLKEPAYPPKILGILIVLIGLALVSLG
jgi:drug/metabolite transporter (DMT)-like permease